ncbi:MAG: hypothetical protein ABS79_06210 [Planctomycetes bacterium SCN 63-9]|nr:MAG: hypothetical protein ABS79_06210 [Planctomycetes bacterium SCN 63-9]
MPASLPIPVYSTLAAMISPALFMTATGSLIISTSNRMSRIIDRVRSLNNQADELTRGDTKLDFPEDRLAHILEEIKIQIWRSERVRWSLTLLYLAMSLFVGTSLAMAFDVLLGSSIGALPTTLAIAGVSLLMFASVQLTREAHAALRGNRMEIRFYQMLRERRKTSEANVVMVDQAS